MSESLRHETGQPTTENVVSHSADYETTDMIISPEQTTHRCEYEDAPSGDACT